MKRKIAAILAADIAGYTRLVAEDEENTLTRLASYREVFGDFVARSGGRVFNTAGDAVLAEFPSAVEATRCAIDIQESLRTRNLGYPQSRQMLFRMGLTIGDVVEREGDLLGDGVNIAARLEGLAQPGGICVSQAVFEQVANKLSVPFRDLGRQDVKNVPQPVHAFMVDMHPEGASGGIRRGRPSVLDGQNARGGSPGRAAVVAMAVALAGLGTGAVYLWGARTVPPKSPDIAATVKTPQQTALKSSAVAPDSGSVSAEDRAPIPANGTVAPPLRQAALPVDPKPPASGAAGNGPVQPPPQARPAIPGGATPAEIFALLGKAGGIVSDAATAPELYHNARVWEARGQAAEARQAYGKLAALGVEAIDAHMRYAAILRAQDGRAGAREVFAALAEGKGGRAAALVHALQFSGAERRKRVTAFAAQHPDYAPAQLLAAREYSAERLGSQTLQDRQAQFAALKGFLSAEDQGTLPKFFMDHSVLAEWIDDARKRHAQLEKYFATAVLKPVASFMRSNQGWMVNISLPEAATGISYRIGESGDFRPTGSFPQIDQRTGQPMANPSFELPPNAGAAMLHIRYRDANNVEQGPFALQFEPRQALVRSQRDILERFSNGWLVFGKESVQQGLLYFTHLVSYRCAIAKAVIGFDDGPLTRELPVPACDMRDPHAVPRGTTPYLRIPSSVRSVRIQLTYADGTRSAEKTFTRE
ncbi:MAG: adenylate/guanylate cyclase domain-containing protein [Beijerinckiaceae bacterium]